MLRKLLLAVVAVLALAGVAEADICTVDYPMKALNALEVHSKPDENSAVIRKIANGVVALHF